MKTKYLVIGVFVALVIGTGLGLGSVYENRIQNAQTEENNLDLGAEGGDGFSEVDTIGGPDGPLPPVFDGKLKADVFTGTLEEVNTGCFADGECFVTISGKHVTVLRGWSQEIVGSVQGVPGFGDLESHIGESVEVYAQELQDGTYTLYGSEGFYITLRKGTSNGSSRENEGIRVGEPYPGFPGDDPGVGDEPKPQVVTGGCEVGGCSSQLCGEADVVRDIMTTCEYRAEYACYQVATCERQTNGQCGWTETSELTQCLQDTRDGQVM